MRFSLCPLWFVVFFVFQKQPEHEEHNEPQRTQSENICLSIKIKN